MLLGLGKGSAGRWLGPAGGFLLAAALALVARPGTIPALAAPGDPAAPPAPIPAPAEGEDEELSCKDCHEEVFDASTKAIHAKVVADPNLDSCEMCHSGGKVHIKLAQASSTGKLPPGGGFAKAPDCLLCHRHEPARHEKELPAWRERKSAACTTCHRAHMPKAETAKGRGLAEKATAESLKAAGASPAGEAACSKCHDAPVKDFRASAHGKALADKGAASCESCHGPASLHVATGGSRRGILPAPRTDTAAMAALCLSCHEKDAPDHARDFAASKYAEGGRTCATCHRIHQRRPIEGFPEGGFATLAEARKGAVPVGSARCADCHKDPHPGLDRSRHGPLMAKDRQGCEGCHGNGWAHAASAGKRSLILNPVRLEPAARDGICLSCHEAKATPASWERHPHGQAGIGCLACHDPFSPPGYATKAPQPGLCARCHGVQVAQFRLPNHHPVETGAVKCSDCHDMHRPSSPLSAAKRWTDACAACHRFEATPRMFPHEAGRADGCIACHEPHGSTSPRLLRFSRVVDLCLSCHIPPATHDLSPGAGYASCLACHTEIHGSDAHRRLLR